MESIELQKLFFQHIKSKINNHVSYVDEIAEVLAISNDSAYRRIRGEKPISLEEIQKLCRKFQISLDHMLSLDTNSTVFYGNWIGSENFDFAKYLDDMLRQLKSIAASEKTVLYYETKDIPPFRNFQFMELSRFKNFFWMKTILSYPDFSKMCFEDYSWNDQLKKTGLEIIKTYNSIPTVEIWSAETITSTLHQIEFYKDSGVFKNKETSNLIYDELLKLVNHIEEEAEAGEKFLMGTSPTGNKDNFKIFFNEIFLGHNTILIENDNEPKTVFINHGVLNYMITRDKDFCAATKKSLDNTLKKSSLISAVNEKDRHRYFNMLRNKIDLERKD